MAAVIVFPTPVEKKDQVEPPVQIRLGMFVEIRVYSQDGAGQTLVNATAVDVRSRDQGLNTAQRLQEAQKSAAVQLPEEVAEGRSELGFVAEPQFVCLGEVPLCRCGPVTPPFKRCIRPRKVSDHLVEIRLRQELVYDNVGKWSGVYKACPAFSQSS